MTINPVEMSGGDFADWAERTFGVDYDNVRLWDMLKRDNPTMPFDFETAKGGEIPTELREILIARKAARVIQPRVPFVPTPDRWDFDGE